MRQEEFVYQKINENFSFVMDCFSSFDKNESGRLRRMIQDKEDKSFCYLSFDNSVPSIILIWMRQAGCLEDLADRIIRMMDTNSFEVEEPIIAPDIRNLVFLHNND